MFIDNVNQISKEKLIGKIIAFPTDTVFGIGALIDDRKAIHKIYELKKRDYNKPLAVLASKIDDILPYIEKPNEEVFKIMKRYWPGALTIIFKKTNKINLFQTNNLDTIAFRIPNDETALKILEKTGPLATTSVNLSGSAPMNTYQEIDDTFGEKIDYLFTKNVNSSNVSSTIVDVSGEEINIIRQGQIKIK